MSDSPESVEGLLPFSPTWESEAVLFTFAGFGLGVDQSDSEIDSSTFGFFVDCWL